MVGDPSLEDRVLDPVLIVVVGVTLCQTKSEEMPEQFVDVVEVVFSQTLKSAVLVEVPDRDKSWSKTTDSLLFREGSEESSLTGNDPRAGVFPACTYNGAKKKGVSSSFSKVREIRELS